MAAPFAEDSVSIGFDGSEVVGKAAILAHLKPIFDHHETPTYISKVREVRFLEQNAVILRAIEGMVPPGHSEINPSLNAHQTVVAEKKV